MTGKKRKQSQGKTGHLILARFIKTLLKIQRFPNALKVSFTWDKERTSTSLPSFRNTRKLLTNPSQIYRSRMHLWADWAKKNPKTTQLQFKLLSPTMEKPDYWRQTSNASLGLLKDLSFYCFKLKERVQFVSTKTCCTRGGWQLTGTRSYPLQRGPTLNAYPKRGRAVPRGGPGTHSGCWPAARWRGWTAADAAGAGAVSAECGSASPCWNSCYPASSPPRYRHARSAAARSSTPAPARGPQPPAPPHGGPPARQSGRVWRRGGARRPRRAPAGP